MHPHVATADVSCWRHRLTHSVPVYWNNNNQSCLLILSAGRYLRQTYRCFCCCCFSLHDIRWDSQMDRKGRYTHTVVSGHLAIVLLLALTAHDTIRLRGMPKSGQSVSCCNSSKSWRWWKDKEGILYRLRACFPYCGHEWKASTTNPKIFRPKTPNKHQTNYTRKKTTFYSV